MRKVKYNHNHRQARKRKYRCIPTVIFLLFLCAVIVFGGYKAKRAELADIQTASLAVQLQTTNIKLLQLAQENSDLRNQLLISHSIATSDNTKAITRIYLAKYFGQDAPTAEKIFTCESNLNNLVVSRLNTNGTRDWGIAQINDVHKAQFEKMFPGVKFETGVLDFSMNIQFAKYLYDSSGFNPWTCAKIVNVI